VQFWRRAPHILICAPGPMRQPVASAALRWFWRLDGGPLIAQPMRCPNVSRAQRWRRVDARSLRPASLYVRVPRSGVVIAIMLPSDVGVPAELAEAGCAGYVGPARSVRVAAGVLPKNWVAASEKLRARRWSGRIDIGRGKPEGSRSRSSVHSRRGLRKP